jgi:hypothetical protein
MVSLRHTLRQMILAAFLLCFPLLIAAHATQPERLTRFYRATQLQGHLFGMGLTRIPAFLEDPSLAFPYVPRPGAAAEIPFVDSFTINRMMGGYRQDWLEKFHLADPEFGRRSLDYVIRRKDGSLQFRPGLIRRRLQPYLDAGYHASDITLALDNTPWDLATPDHRPPEQGPWGRNTPPGDLREWSAVVRHFAQDMKDYLGIEAASITFETGIEYDEKASFAGDADAFFQYYLATDRALHDVLPGAHLTPGEFTGLGVCPAQNRDCVYDEQAFARFAAEANIMPAMLPRSLHSLVDRPNPFPSAAVQRVAASYARLPAVVREIHQFGLLFEPFGEADSSDPGPMQANWEFQTLAGLMAEGAPRRVFHWGGVITVGPMQFVNGSGVLRLVLDHYLGRDVSLLPARDSAGFASTAQIVAMRLNDGTAEALILSSFSPHPSAALRPVVVDLPDVNRRDGHRLRVFTYAASDNVFSAIAHDLAAEGNLKPAFLACPLCLGSPTIMATDATRARTMLARNWPRYVLKMQAGLRWQESGASVRLTGRTITATLEANELMVIEQI